MIIHHLPHQNNVQQIGYKSLSVLNFKGKRGEEVARTLISACLWKDSVVRPESKEEALVHAFITRIVSLAHLEQVRATLEPLSSQLNLPLIEKQERLQLTWLENVISGTNLNLRHTLLKYHHLAEELARDLGLSGESTAKVMEKLNDVLGSIP